MMGATGRFYHLKTLERLACQVLARYCRATAAALKAPIRSEHLLDVVYAEQLSSPLWDSIPEPLGRTVLAGLAPEQHLIVMNEARRELFEEVEGLANTVLAHEIGHWELHVDKALLDHQRLPGFTYELSFTCVRGEGGSWDEKNAHRFMGFLLLPSELLVPRARDTDLTSWRGLYDLRQEFEVSITALKIRLEDLGFTYVDRDGVFHASRQEAAGQRRLL